MRWLFITAALFTLSVQSVVADVAAGQVQAWLQRMIHSVHSLDYEGTFVYLYDNHLEAIQVTHWVDESGERERLVSLNGAAREVVRDEASVTCVAPDTRSVSVGRRMVQGFQAIFAMDVALLSNYYDFQFLGNTRIAGRQARVVAVVPRDKFRYGYRVYLDQENFLPLKSDMLNAKSEVLSQVMFTTLKTGGAVTERNEPSLEGTEDYSWVNRRPMRQMPDRQSEEWRFEALPPGFQIGLYIHSSTDLHQPNVDHIVLSDGLASVSVYVEPVGKEPGLRGAALMGAISAYGRQLDGYQVTVVGEAPAVMVEKVANAIRPPL